MRPDQKLYWVWADMLSRCRNANHKHYKNYGGRGIRVCDRWLTFENFKIDMGERPHGGMLDRCDNDGNYDPNNCRWATRKEQNSNRRSCLFVDDAGERVTLKEYCRRHELRYRAIVKRIRDRNWPLEMALKEPVGPGKKFQKISASDALGGELKGLMI